MVSLLLCVKSPEQTWDKLRATTPQGGTSNPITFRETAGWNLESRNMEAWWEKIRSWPKHGGTSLPPLTSGAQSGAISITPLLIIAWGGMTGGEGRVTDHQEGGQGKKRHLLDQGLDPIIRLQLVHTEWLTAFSCSFLQNKMCFFFKIPKIKERKQKQHFASLKCTFEQQFHGKTEWKKVPVCIEGYSKCTLFFALLKGWMASSVCTLLHPKMLGRKRMFERRKRPDPPTTSVS